MGVRVALATFITATTIVVPSSATSGVHVDAPFSPGSVVRAGPPLPVTCDGDGHSGRRIQFLYGYLAGHKNRLGSFRELLQTRAAQVDEIYRASAAATGGVRHLRIEHDGACLAVIKAVALGSDAYAGNLFKLASQIGKKGYNRADRKYIVFSEYASRRFGGIALVSDDANPSSYNNSNQQQLYGLISRTFPGGGFPSSSWWSETATAHEIGHTLGAVQQNTPHHTDNYHCTDGLDVMCYSDGSPQVYNPSVCTAIGTDDHRLDCNHDDYYSTAPVGFLATTWNVANSEYLIGAPNGAATDIAAAWALGSPTYKMVKKRLYAVGTLNLFDPAVGGNSTRSSVVEFFLSADTVLDASDLRLGSSINVGTLIPSGGTFARAVKIRLPGRSARVGKYLIAAADATNVLPEADENNNIAVGPPITR